MVMPISHHAAQMHPTLSLPTTRRNRLGEDLLAAGLLTPDQMQLALHEQQQQGGLLGQVLCRLGYITEHELCRLLANRSGMAMLDLDGLTPELDLLRRIPHEYAERWQILPLTLHDGMVVVAAYGVGGNTSLASAPPAAEVGVWFAALLQEALACGASDIHCVPEAKALHIRLRVDGVMHNLKTMHRDFWPALLQRLKILAAVNIAETRLPQDGRFSQPCGDFVLDCRVGFMPTIHGEAVALRLLDPRRAQRSFASMGFTPPQIMQFQDWLQRPEGLILVTGPTGSGKSTTLNAMLHALDKTSRTIMTLEDPVEYQFDGIRQTQVREQHGMGFAEGVRTLLRHDPDVILIGEIRDAATAQQAMRAAMTGHLVLTSLHTNNARGAVPRLLDLGVSRDLLAQHLRGVVAQRLVRTRCLSCSSPHETPLVSYAANAETARHCPDCFGSGRRGRTVVAEVLAMPDHGAALFGHGAAADYATMWQQGMILVDHNIIAYDDLVATVPQ
jgi:type II secretory ATPase GspE/PulE/Tfp pilus assembly ATPase PilB-like protein